MNRRELVRTLALGAAAATMPISTIRSAPAPLPPPNVHTPDLDEAVRSHVWACWIGHATVLMFIGGKWILTDPVLFDAYGVNVLGVTIGPRRLIRPALSIDEIPRPDLILLSHAHLDHMDRTTLIEMSERYQGQIDVITATRTMDVISDLPWKSLNEMDWGETASVHGIEL